MKTTVAGVLSMTFIAAEAFAENVTIKTPRGTIVNVSVDRPAGADGRSPVLIIAPGQGYHKELPLIKMFAHKAVAAGLVVYRFDWGYFSADPKSGRPSDKLQLEAEDMQTVINHAKADTAVDSSRIVLAGKSIGSRVSYQIFNASKDYRGLILMTPICTDPDTGKSVGTESYPSFSQNTRPISFILGDSDALCKIPTLYDFAHLTAGNVTINVLKGGHSLTVGAPGDAANAKIDAVNLDLATSTATLWAQLALFK